MLAEEIIIRTGDSHPIFDLKTNLIKMIKLKYFTKDI